MLHTDIFKTYKAPDEAVIDELLNTELAKNKKKIVVLDDDPTGTQTVHDVSVYTSPDEENLRMAFQGEDNIFYILTNSRSMTREETTKYHNDLAAAVDKVSKELGIDYMYISRSDSTLRGHYPLEPQILRDNYERYTGRKLDGEILCPFFLEGGRYTIDDVHYVRYGNDLVPACESEFAKDVTFGYSAYTMPEYIEEKTAGAYKAGNVTCISLNDLRNADIDKINAQLMAVEGFNKIIVNAIDYIDIKVFCVALFRAMNSGKSFMFRSAASLVRVMGGITAMPLLTREQMILQRTGKDTDVAGASAKTTQDASLALNDENISAAPSNGGIIVVGSHTDMTTRQLNCLKDIPGIEFIELDVSMVKDEEAFEREVQRCLDKEEDLIKDGKTVCCFTTRTLITADTGDTEDDLRLSVRISDAVQSLVGRLDVTPSFVIAKGGITSSDVATKALGIKRAYSLGQIKPGIPVWRTGPESRFPGIPLVIFPGNVGEDTTLKEAAQILMQ